MRRLFPIVAVLLVLVLCIISCIPTSTPTPAPAPPPPAPPPTPAPTQTPTPTPTPPPAAEFQVISLSINPMETTAEEIVSITAVVKNIGGSEGTYAVILSVDGVTAEVKETALITPDSSEVVTFSLVKDVPGTYEIDIGGLSSSLIVKTNEIVDYAKSLNLPLNVVNELRVLGPEMDWYEKELIELVSGHSEPVQIKIVRQLTTDSKVSKEEVNTLKYLWKFLRNVQGEFIDLGLDGDVLNFLTIVSTLPDQGFAEYAVINKLCIQDRKLTDLESNFLGEPERYSHELLTQYLVDLGSIYAELADELRKLPDFKQANIKNLEAAEDVLSLASNPEHRTFFEAVLSEGIKDKRKYCMPLEALVWTFYDLENELLEVMLISWERSIYVHKIPTHISLVRYAWGNSSESNSYLSDRWKDFEEVVGRLNSPNMVSVYIIDNIPYSMERRKLIRRSPNWLSITMTPKEVFEKKIAVCQSHSRFALYCLIRNGYTYNDFDKYPDKAAVILQACNEQAKPSPSGSHRHFTCLYIENGKFYLIDDRFLHSHSVIRGPYNTIEEAADFTYPDPGWNEYKFHDINMSVTKSVYRR